MCDRLRLVHDGHTDIGVSAYGARDNVPCLLFSLVRCTTVCTYHSVFTKSRFLSFLSGCFFFSIRFVIRAHIILRYYYYCYTCTSHSSTVICDCSVRLDRTTYLAIVIVVHTVRNIRIHIAVVVGKQCQRTAVWFEIDGTRAAINVQRFSAKCYRYASSVFWRFWFVHCTPVSSYTIRLIWFHIVPHLRRWY